MISKNLDRKILIVLSLCVTIITAIIIGITNHRLTKGIIEEFTTDSKETMSVIAAGIRQTMAIGNSVLIENQLLDIKNENRNIELFICDTDQRIVFSSEAESLQKPLQQHVANYDLIKALERSFHTGSMSDDIFSEDRDKKRYFMHAHLMSNHPQCFRCHGSEKKILGAVILRKPVERNYKAIADVTNSNIFIGIIGICAVIFLSQTLIARLISRPIHDLSRQIAELPTSISNGTLVNMTEIVRADEIGILQKSFHTMAVEIYEKNHALEKSNAELASVNRELESFAYSVSHDLRAPLRNIDGFSKILMDDYAADLPEKARHYLMRVRNGTSRMSMLIDDILSFSRIGRAELNLRKMPAIAMVKNVLEHFSGEIEKRGVSVILEDLPEINCDPVLMQSLFSNLISNALKYSRNTDSPKIIIGFDQMRKLIYVRDNGIGFEMQYHDKIFQIFQRLHLPEEYEGTGIGLAIVRRIAERHHGRIWAESEPGKGSTFYVELPILQEAL